RNCGRNWLEDCELWLNTAAVEQDRLNRFWYSVPANALRSVPRHESDDQTADNRNRDNEKSKMMAARRNQFCCEALVEEQISKKPDQLQQTQCNKCTEYADGYSQSGDRQ